MKENKATSKAPTFTKAQLVGAKRYKERRDLLNAILSDDKTYTHEEVGRLMNEFMNKKGW